MLLCAKFFFFLVRTKSGYSLWKNKKQMKTRTGDKQYFKKAAYPRTEEIHGRRRLTIITAAAKILCVCVYVCVCVCTRGKYDSGSEGTNMNVKIITAATMSNISNKFSRESPYIFNTFSRQSPRFQTSFHMRKRSFHHSKGLPRNRVDLEIQNLKSDLLCYWVATISRLLKIIGLFCKRAL